MLCEKRCVNWIRTKCWKLFISEILLQHFKCFDSSLVYLFLISCRSIWISNGCIYSDTNTFQITFDNTKKIVVNVFHKFDVRRSRPKCPLTTHLFRIVPFICLWFVYCIQYTGTKYDLYRPHTQTERYMLTTREHVQKILCRQINRKFCLGRKFVFLPVNFKCTINECSTYNLKIETKC